MLMCTRGITGEKALEIQKTWTTPRSFFEALEQCGGGNKNNNKKGRGSEELLQVELGGKKKIGRKRIGKAVAAKLAQIWGED